MADVKVQIRTVYAFAKNKRPVLNHSKDELVLFRPYLFSCTLWQYVIFANVALYCISYHATIQLIEVYSRQWKNSIETISLVDKLTITGNDRLISVPEKILFHCSTRCIGATRWYLAFEGQSVWNAECISWKAHSQFSNSYYQLGRINCAQQHAFYRRGCCSFARDMEWLEYPELLRHEAGTRVLARSIHGITYLLQFETGAVEPININTNKFIWSLHYNT